MNDKLNGLPGKLKLLENELLVEIHAKEKQFGYTVRTARFISQKAFPARIIGPRKNFFDDLKTKPKTI